MEIFEESTVVEKIIPNEKTKASHEAEFQLFLKHFKYVVRHECDEPEADVASHFYYELYIASIFYNAFLNTLASE